MYSTQVRLISIEQEIENFGMFILTLYLVGSIIYVNFVSDVLWVLFFMFLVSSFCFTYRFGRFLKVYYQAFIDAKPQGHKVMYYKTLVALTYWTLCIMAIVPEVSIDDVVWRCTQTLYPQVFTIVSAINTSVALIVIIIHCCNSSRIEE